MNNYWFLNRKIIFFAVGLILLAEAAWAVWSLRQSSTTMPAETSQPSAVSSSPVLAAIVLTGDKTEVRRGEKVVVTIGLDSGSLTDGIDLILSYDPKLLSVVPSVKNSPVAVGSLYTDYPINSLDEKSGRIVVSGINSREGGVLAKGIFGTVMFQAKESGTAKVGVEFNPGSTTDSNIIEEQSGRDLLGQVNGLEIKVTP